MVDDHPSAAHDQALVEITTFYRRRLAVGSTGPGARWGRTGSTRPGSPPTTRRTPTRCSTACCARWPRPGNAGIWRRSATSGPRRCGRATGHSPSGTDSSTRNARCPPTCPRARPWPTPAKRPNRLDRDPADPQAGPEIALEQDEADALIAEAEYAEAVHAAHIRQVRIALAERGRRPSRPRTHWDALAVDLFNHQHPHDLDDPRLRARTGRSGPNRRGTRRDAIRGPSPPGSNPVRVPGGVLPGGRARSDRHLLQPPGGPRAPGRV